jgi:hypothetical protein
MNGSNAVLYKYMDVSEKQIPSIFSFYPEEKDIFPFETATNFYHTTRRYATETSFLRLALLESQILFEKKSALKVPFFLSLKFVDAKTY